MTLLLALAVASLSIADQDGAVATAPAGQQAVTAALASGAAAPVVQQEPSAGQAMPHGLTTAQQVERWVSADRPRSQDELWLDAPVENERRMHGEVWGGVGTGGYRDIGGAVSLPLGESGRLDLRFQRTEGEGLWAPYPGFAYGVRPFGAADE